MGFRPFIYQLAKKNNLAGWVLNSSTGVEIEVEGEKEELGKFIYGIKNNPPSLAKITHLNLDYLPLKGYELFSIKDSLSQINKSVLISPDICICQECLLELFDKDNRRYRYPFINCTNCGPRYTIIEDIPYDRVNTSMKVFKMCSLCEEEYNNPSHRRFHAQPNACWNCGPQMELWDDNGYKINTDDPIRDIIASLRKGNIIAIKGMGGFHLAVNAEDESAVKRLRQRKKREEKALAIMSLNFEKIKEICKLSGDEEKLLNSPQSPIVLLKKLPSCKIAEVVAPHNKYLGVMLPYTPLHYILLKESQLNLVMTSGNISNEPIAIDNQEAIKKLSGIADYFLIHDRDIYLRSDDSVAKFIDKREMIIRRSRGYVPSPVILKKSLREILAVGAELKNTVCLTKMNNAFLSQHIGDLENVETLMSFEKSIEHLKQILQINPEIIAYDLHPEYLSTKYAKGIDKIPLIGVQHHHAHIASCMAENNLDGDVIGVSFDGNGYGTDGCLWGSEFLIVNYKKFIRRGHFRYIPMPGGTAAVREPYRMAISYLYSVFREQIKDLDIDCLYGIQQEEIELYIRMIDRGINSPLTSSCGRLFDAVSSLLGIRDKISYEGQAAIELEMFTIENDNCGEYPYEIESEKTYIINPEKIINGIVKDLKGNMTREYISTRFHNTISKIIIDLCGFLRKETGLDRVVLSGGVFQNSYLLKRLLYSLDKNKFKVYIHHKVPTNDGGISLGQAVIANYKKN